MKYCIKGRKKGLSNPLYLNQKMEWTGAPCFYKSKEGAKNFFNNYSSSKNNKKDVKLVDFISEKDILQPEAANDVSSTPVASASIAETDSLDFNPIQGKLDAMLRMKKNIEECAALHKQISTDKQAVADYCSSILSDCDKATMDLLHYVELKNFNASEGYSYAAELQAVRKARRIAKDTMTLLSLSPEVSNNELSSLESAIATQKNRHYRPRILPDNVKN